MIPFGLHSFYNLHQASGENAYIFIWGANTKGERYVFAYYPFLFFSFTLPFQAVYILPMIWPWQSNIIFLPVHLSAVHITSSTWYRNFFCSTYPSASLSSIAVALVSAQSYAFIYLAKIITIFIIPAVKYRRFYLLKFPSAALLSIVVALATTHSSALQMKIYSA